MGEVTSGALKTMMDTYETDLHNYSVSVDMEKCPAGLGGDDALVEGSRDHFKERMCHRVTHRGYGDVHFVTAGVPHMSL